MYYLFDFAFLALVYFVFFYRKWGSQSLKVLIVNTLMYVYISMVFFVTLMPFTMSLLLEGSNNLFMNTANFIPFRDLRLQYSGAVREIVLNIIMMMPFGFLYPIIKKKQVVATVLMAFLFSLSIECLQLVGARWGGIASRSFDVTDLVTNTFGGLIGYLLFLTFRPIINKLLKIFP